MRKGQIISAISPAGPLRHSGAAWLLLSFVLLPLTVRAVHTDTRLSQLIHQQWQTQDGLPQNSVNALLQDRNGFIWFGTEAGLVRFDGVDFDIFDQSYFHGDFHNYIFQLTEARDGRLWVGTRGGGVFCLAGTSIVDRLSTKQGLPSNQIWSLTEGTDGSIWIGTRNGLGRYFEGKLTVYHPADGLPSDQVNALYCDAQGTLWIGGDKGAFASFDGKRFTLYPPSQLKFDSPVKAIVPDPDGGLWVGMDGDGLYRFSDGKLAYINFYPEKPLLNIQCLFISPEGQLWIGTQHYGLIRYTNSKREDYSMREGLSYSHVSSIFECREGTIWIGTVSGGLNRLREGKVRTFGMQEGLANENITSVLECEDGRLMIGTNDGGLILGLDRSFYPIFLGEFARKSIRALASDSAGSVWIGTAGGGIGRITDQKLKFYTTEEGLPHNDITTLFLDSQEHLWVGTQNAGLALYNRAKDLFEARPEVELRDNIRALAEGPDRALWIATQHNGVYTLRGERLEPALSSARQITVRCLYFDKEGILWVGTREDGLLRCTGDKTVAITSEQGLVNNQVSQILEVDDDFWLTTNRGIERIPRKDLERVSGGGGRLEPELLNEIDGMRISECSSGGSPPGCKGRDGRLWIPTNRGLVLVEPRRMPRNTNSPPVLIKSILLDEQQEDPRVFRKIPAGTVRLEIQYTSTSLRVPSKVRFKYKLEGVDKEWVNAGFRREAIYYNLKPRAYSFRVRACNEDGVWSDPDATLHFAMAPYFHQTRSFYASLIALVGLAGWGGLRWRVRQVAKQAETLSLMVTERTAQLETANDRLKSEAHERREMELRFSAFMNNSPAVAWMKDHELRYVYWNPQFKKTFPHLHLVEGQTDFDIWPLETAQQLRENDLRTLKTGETIQLSEIVPSALGESMTWWVFKFPFRTASGQQFVAGMGVDVTEQKRAEAALHTLPQRIIDAQEQERRRVARELHDSVKQAITATQFRLASLSQQVNSGSDKWKATIKTASDMLEAAVQEVSRISRNLLPSELDDLGLYAALAGMRRDFIARTGIDLEINTVPFPKSMPKIIELNLYRIIQESLANTEKHSHATRVTVSFDMVGNDLILDISDNGIGFDSGALLGGEAGMGLVNMRERATAIGALFSLASMPGTGVQIHIKLSLLVFSESEPTIEYA